MKRGGSEEDMKAIEEYKKQRGIKSRYDITSSTYSNYINNKSKINELLKNDTVISEISKKIGEEIEKIFKK